MNSEVLEDIKADVAQKIGSVKVEKVLDPEFDLNDLVIFDQNPLMIDTKVGQLQTSIRGRNFNPMYPILTVYLDTIWSIL